MEGQSASNLFSVVSSGTDAVIGGGELATTAMTEKKSRRPPSQQRKRAIALTAFIACLGCIIVVLNALTAFLLDLAKNESLWQYLHNKLNYSCSDRGSFMCTEPVVNK